MDILQEARDSHKKSFLSHVFSTTEEGKAEVLNVVQYATLGVIPIVILNKLVQRFIPEADGEKSTLELVVEIFLQLLIMFCGVIVVHRMITYLPTYSGFKYESLTLTNVILTFLIVVLSIQTKLGIKVNILADRAYEMWNGQSEEVRASKKTQSNHVVSQSDYYDMSAMNNIDAFPPAPVVTSKPSSGGGGYNQTAAATTNDFQMSGPQAANSVLGGSFGSFF
jgi:hypothetical protein